MRATIKDGLLEILIVRKRMISRVDHQIIKEYDQCLPFAILVLRFMWYGWFEAEKEDTKNAAKVTSSTMITMYFNVKRRVEVFFSDLCLDPLKAEDFRWRRLYL